MRRMQWLVHERMVANEDQVVTGRPWSVITGRLWIDCILGLEGRSSVDIDAKLTSERRETRIFRSDLQDSGARSASFPEQHPFQD